MNGLTCPKCGYSLEEEGAILATCPRCEAELLTIQNQPLPLQPFAAPIQASDKLDVAALMRRVLAEQRPREDIDAALERVVAKEHPENAAQIIQTLQQHFKLHQDRLGNSRQQAAEILAKSIAFLSFDLEGKPSMEAMMFEAKGLENLPEETRLAVAEQMKKVIVAGKSVPQLIVGQPVVNFQGLENLSEEDRMQILEQMKEAVLEGRPFPRNIVIGSRRVVKLQGTSGLTTIVLAALVLGALILVYLLSRH